jgi:RNA polymerase sigma-70 factor, ECF subfamily
VSRLPPEKSLYGVVAAPALDSLRHSGEHARLGVVRTLPLVRDDREMVEALKGSEPWARAVLFDRYARDAERVLARILGSDSELQDLVQDVFVRALEGIDRLQDPDKLRSWIVAIAVFTARERIRARRRKWWMVLFPHGAIDEMAVQAAEDEDGELVDATYRVLDSLPDDERIALALRMIDGMDLIEVAQACGVSLATIKRRLSKAQTRFRALAAREPALQQWAKGGAS